MHFLSPAAFWFAASLPIVVVFYLLKRKRVVRLVGSTLLWQKFLAETQASAPFQRLRHNWLLILQLLLLLLAILALARPYFAGKSSGGRTVVVILDASASMQSTDETPSRFEKSRAEALELVNSLHESDQMVVLEAGAHAEVKQSPTSEKAALRRVIQATRASDSPTRLIEALKLAETLVQSNPKAEIHLFSDGASPNLNEFENRSLPLFFHKIGQRGDNLGIVNLDVRANPENPAQRAVFTTVSNSSTNARQTELELRFGDRVIEVKSITIPPRQSSPNVFIVSQTEDGVFSVRITAKDDLAADNESSIVSLLPKPVKVLIVTAGNRFLQKAINAIPNAQLSEAASLTDTASDFDVVILDNVTPAVWPAGNFLAMHVAHTNLFDKWGAVDSPQIVDWKGSHPLLRFVGFDNVQIGQSLAVKTPPWALSLVESPQTPLMLAGEIGRQRAVWVGFDLLQSTWPLRISFPIFMANAIDWLNPASAQASLLNIKSGDPFRIGLNDASGKAQITLPDGTIRQREIDAVRREIVFGETSRQGTYRLKAGTNELVFAANLLNAAESDTTPKQELQFGKYAKVATTTLKQANLEFWRWLALAGLAVLMFEWWYYHRRTA